MIRLIKISAIAAALTVGLAFAAPASAQATRTWVSGVGDDVNPCSRTAPCKTFAGAISKTAAGGEINCLDPGGYGAVTITKSLTISCPYTEGGVLAGGNGIVINDSATASPGTILVHLRGLDIFGVSPPTHGVRFVSGAGLIIEDSTIRRFNSVNSFGISFAPSTNALLVVKNVTIIENGNGASGGGIGIMPTGANGTARVTLRDVRISANAGNGILLDTTAATNVGGSFMAADDVVVSRNGTGIRVLVPSGASPTTSMITNSLIANNAANGLVGDGSAATVRVGNTTITGNGTGVSALNLSQVRSYGDNRNDGNASDGAFSAGILPKE